MAEERKWLEGLLGCRIQIQVSDGRLLEGIFSCVDRGCNVILRNTTEWKLSRAQDSNEENATSRTTREFRRNIGISMVPGDHLVRISVNKAGVLPEFEVSGNLSSSDHLVLWKSPV
eukprot:gene569-3886_t